MVSSTIPIHTRESRAFGWVLLSKDSPSRGSDGVVDAYKWVVGPTVKGPMVKVPTVVGPIASGGLLDGSRWVSVVLMGLGAVFGVHWTPKCIDV
nr:hypothetical protein CFP56_18382 [Quercus suber]